MALVLSRRTVGEFVICLGPAIIWPVETSGDRARLAFNASESTMIFRLEVIWRCVLKTLELDDLPNGLRPCLESIQQMLMPVFGPDEEASEGWAPTAELLEQLMQPAMVTLLRQAKEEP